MSRRRQTACDAPPRSAAPAATPAFRAAAPRPLAAHLAAGLADLAQAAATASKAVASTAEAGDRPPFAAALADARAGHGSDAVLQAVTREGLSQLQATLDGVAAYQTAPPVRRPKEPPTIWRAGAARMLDFGATPEARCAADAPTLLIAPSLLNRPRILDLTRARSLLRGLSRRGVRPLLLDWGDPGGEERGFDLEAYVVKRLEPALAAAARRDRGARAGPVFLLGHCMAGPLAAAAAQRRPEWVAGLVLLAAPWRFSALRPDAPEVAASPRARTAAARDLEAMKTLVARLIEACGAVFGGVPPELVNTLFLLRDPTQALRKFPQFATLRRNSARGRLFMAIEDWLNDGVRLAAPAARDLFLSWTGEDAVARGAWRVAGRPLALERITAPALVVGSANDTVTPEISTEGWTDRLRRAERLRPRGGHVAMLVGPKAETELWDPLAAWIRSEGARAAR